MTDEEWIEQWFGSYAKRIIPRHEKDTVLAQMALYAHKDGSDPSGVEYQKVAEEVKDFVRRHNEKHSMKLSETQKEEG